uniref:Uncharacterized protein n=1 Tax=Anguilla anguilla TaxID=7936 RepID=A0A0E9W294_ANGAN
MLSKHNLDIVLHEFKFTKTTHWLGLHPSLYTKPKPFESLERISQLSVYQDSRFLQIPKYKYK